MSNVDNDVQLNLLFYELQWTLTMYLHKKKSLFKGLEPPK